MKLDATDLRYVTTEEFRVLTAVEMGSKNHEVVPSVLISRIAGLRSGGVNKILGSLAKRNLISKVQNTKYDGYRLTYGGYDFLAMRALSKRDSMFSVGNQIGVGKESDIYVVADADGKQMLYVSSASRLGRISFRAIKEKRDYLGKRKSASWIRQISDVPSPGKLYSQLMDLIVRFAHAGLIHGDFNEFNILIQRETGEPIVIDFPQMVSTSHENAEWYFNRDVECIRRFFRRRFRYESMLYPRFKVIMKEGSEKGDGFQLDVMVAASGFGKKEMETLEEYMENVKDEPQSQDEDDDEEMVEDSDESDEEREDKVNEEVEGTRERGTAEARSSSSESEGNEGDAEGTAARTNLLADDADSAADEDSASPARSEASAVSSRRSRAPSPTDSLIAHTASMMLAHNADESTNADFHSTGGPPPPDTHSVKERVASEISRLQARQKSKYHSRGARKIGRPTGSKAKQDLRVKVDASGVWE
ncbi:hypothetical protein EW145_g3832 [Phellinidium pouzarii]|uniref:non-specific serine/threonine protein kinase n=1 Tax=Phellinidium pouzarii TaxID=167371 RepID=A0A4S4LAY0_9AGAM|nr:hypothetical protein EW145_g3832 [Phellinidium pouzarii]